MNNCCIENSKIKTFKFCPECGNNLCKISHQELLKYITLLETQSFIGWSENAVQGYKTACCSIKNKILSN